MFPLTEGVRIGGEVLQYTDFTEQRWVEMAQLRRFILSLEDISKADRDTVQTFWDSVKGGFDHTWDITIGGTLYSNMVFEADAFDAREGDKPERWTLTLPCRQVRKN